MDVEADYNHNWLSANCGLRVSKLCFGGATFASEKNQKHANQTPEDQSHQLLDRYVELGGNFIDTANVYSNGDSESIIGSWLAKQPERDQIVIGTKLRFSGDNDFVGLSSKRQNRVGLSRQAIISNLEISLERLRTHYVDLYQIHCYDSGVPIEETLSTIDDLIRQGKIRYFGGSNLTGWQIQKYVEVAKRMGLTSRMVTLQQQYNLINRESEFEAFQVCHNEGIGILPWSPLKGGLLCGKFQKNQKFDETTRVGWATVNSKNSHHSPDFREYENDDKYWKIVAALDDITKAKGKTSAQVALRWVLQRPSVNSVVNGFHTIKQLEENMAAISDSWSLSDTEMQTLNEASRTKLLYPYDVEDMVNTQRRRTLVQ
ncbi:hypothetical protein CAPTEDRAFT_185457 [Capitella teleta]|uniref:NADP-dependent oxidoreductase domain-containing protein n=1 Tax=Capitella teleta TaxID=283909 RepID=R7VCC2_CAPTE|nr:hypothetical protein CAPTEDRAFT_185457 [Capitella teleta]|eukprot:ELU16498.1 hypothetical protein CAPTEDRAFT_185457 [Capitella teleta]